MMSLKLVVYYLAFTTSAIMFSGKFVGAFTTIANRSSRAIASRSFHSTTSIQMAPKPGVASIEELTKLVDSAGDKLVVVDVRNPDAEKEPGDQKSLAVAPIPDPSGGVRPSALHLLWDRDSNSMPLPPDSVAKDTPLITHCGGGGRGQKAKEFLESKGYTNVLNGAGPKETELWNVYGEK
jgi:rhodanese-related sulfurtransferase